MRKIHLFFLKNCLAVVAVFVCCSTFAAPKPRNLPPRELVTRYLEADLNGARLEGDKLAITATAVTWDSEPEDDRLIVSKGFRIDKIKTKRGVTKISVTFQNLGELKGNVYIPDQLNEQALFEVVRRKGKWLIDRPILMPHVTPVAAEKYLMSRLAKVTEGSEEYQKIQASLAALKK